MTVAQESVDWHRFALPAALEAAAPAERRGITRDEVRLLVAGPSTLAHAHFTDVAQYLEPGDLVVANDSATLPAAVDGERKRGGAVSVHFSTPLQAGSWVVELRRDGDRVADGAVGERIELPQEAAVTLLEPWPRDADGPTRLWRARIDVPGDVLEYLAGAGRPITYAHTPKRWATEHYQTIFAAVPGSAEMPSAGRPFSARVLDSLAARGVGVATITLHTGVSSLEEDETPLPERFVVSGAAAAAVNLTRRRGGRVVAVGTTVTRALESVVDAGGLVKPGRGWTELVLGPDRDVRVVDALITGWHEPRSSHLALVEAVAGPEVARRAYEAALASGYLWHEFGDSCLFLRR
jgi:S-adenosylmethionine:tRNA ribosyltransferase-isomerase